MNSFLKNWSIMRLLRLLLGIFIIAQGIVTREWLIAFMGALFSLMPVLNIGCCGTSGCSTPVRKTKGSTEDINYEEIH